MLYVIKKHFFLTETFVGIEGMLSDMYIRGLIRGYNKPVDQDLLKRNLLEIKLNYSVVGAPAYKVAKIVSTQSHVLSIKLDQLKADIRNDSAGLGVIRTAKFGITTTNKALLSKTGGIYVAKFR